MMHGIYKCTLHYSCFFVLCNSDALISWELLDPGEATSPRVSQFLDTVNNLLRTVSFICKVTSGEPTPSNALFFRLLHSITLLPLISALITPGLATRHLKGVPTPQKLFKLVNPKPAYPASLVPSGVTTRKASCPHFPTFLPPDQPGASPCSPAWHSIGLPLSTCNKLSFQWQPPHLLASPNLSNNKLTF